MAHLHSIYDTDLHFIIDPITRKITSESGKVTLMQTDHNSERFTFEIPRYVEGHDMSLTDKIEVHYINIETASPKRRNADVYPVLDLQISPDSDDMVIFSWLISGNVTQYAGSLSFMLRFVCYDDDSVIAYQWWSDAYALIKISATTNNTDSVADFDDTDVLEAWRQECIQAVYESEVFSDLEAYGTNYVEQARAYAEQAKEISGLDTVEPLLNQIQTTSIATLNTAGWYRVAEYVAPKGGNYLIGADSNSCVLVIKRSYANQRNENHVIKLRSAHQKQEFIPYDCFSVVQLFTKIRYVHDGVSTAYLEVYYSGTENNDVRFIVNSPLNANVSRKYTWQAITPTLTEEEVEGVTITTTYDIPANANPVNSEDLVNGAYPMGAVGTDGYIAYPEGGFFKSAVNVTGRIRITLPVTWTKETIQFTVKVYNHTNTVSNAIAEYIINCFPNTETGPYPVRSALSVGQTSLADLPVSFAHDGTNCVITIGGDSKIWNYPRVAITDLVTSGTYTAFDKGWDVSITSDNSDLTIFATVEKPNLLANYYKNTGGEVSGNVDITSANAEYRRMRLKNANRDIRFYVEGNGDCYIYDVTNDKVIAKFPLDGTNNVWKGIASGNLPLDGGGTVTKNSATPLGVKSTSSNSCYIPFYGKDGILGFFGFYGADTPVYLNASASVRKLLTQDNYTDYTVSKDGGAFGGKVTVEANEAIPFGTTNTGSDINVPSYSGASGMLGCLGFNGVDNPVFFNSNAEYKKLFHEGNSAKVTITDSKDDVPDTMEGLWAY